MRTVVGPWLVLAAALTLGAQTPSAPRTMRLDYFHTGSTTQELFALDEVVIEQPHGRKIRVLTIDVTTSIIGTWS